MFNYSLDGLLADEAWADAARPPIGARVAGAVAIVGWIGTVIAARLIAFT